MRRERPRGVLSSLLYVVAYAPPIPSALGVVRNENDCLPHSTGFQLLHFHANKYKLRVEAFHRFLDRTAYYYNNHVFAHKAPFCFYTTILITMTSVIIVCMLKYPYPVILMVRNNETPKCLVP